MQTGYGFRGSSTDTGHSPRLFWSKYDPSSHLCCCKYSQSKPYKTSEAKKGSPLLESSARNSRTLEAHYHFVLNASHLATGFRATAQASLG
jgi:hypothetical protein